MHCLQTIDHFNNALGKLPFQSSKIYLLGDFNINLVFEGDFVLKKYFKRLKEDQLKYRLLKPYAETFFNRDLYCGCLVYLFSLRFSGSKFLTNSRRQFRVRNICPCT